MGKCTNHPDRETSYVCMKQGIYQCRECLRCRSPEIYCKYRSACPIWFVQKNGTRDWTGGEDEKNDEITRAANRETAVSEGASADGC